MPTTISSLGTVLKVTITAVLTTVTGVRDVEWDGPEVETYESDDLGDSFVNLEPTGRSSGGSVKASILWDPAAATNTKLIALFNTPAREDWSIAWGSAPAATQLFNGILKKQNRKAERGSPLMADIEIAVSRKPTLV